MNRRIDYGDQGSIFSDDDIFAPKKRFPLTIEKRKTPVLWQTLLLNLLAVVAAFCVGAVFLKLSGFSPLNVYLMMFDGAFGSSYAISETIVKAIPLMLCALGIAVAFRMNLWNIGAEGQLYMGGLAAGWVALSFTGLPMFVMIPAMMLAAFIGGAFWAMIAAVPRAYLGTNETIVTLMLNYIAIFFTDYLLHGAWRDPAAQNFPLSREFVPAAWLPVLPGGRVHMGLFIGIGVALVLYLVYKYGKWGYETAIIGESPEAARYAGIDVAKNIVLALAISGGIAGLAGMTELSGIIHRVQPNFSPGYGYTAIIIAWLAKLNPWATILVSILFGGLLVGGYSIQLAGLPGATAAMLQGTVLFFVLGFDILAGYRIVFRRVKKSGGDAQ